MSKIYVSISAARSETGKLPSIKTKAGNAKSGVSGLRQSVVSSVQDRNNIRARLNNSYNNIAAIESQIQKLYTELNSSLNKYENLENYLKNQLKSIKNVTLIDSKNATLFDNFSVSAWEKTLNDFIDYIKNLWDSNIRTGLETILFIPQFYKRIINDLITSWNNNNSNSVVIDTNGEARPDDVIIVILNRDRDENISTIK